MDTSPAQGPASAPRCLTAAQCAAYARDGCLFPLRAFDAAQARRARQHLEAAEAAHGPVMAGSFRTKPHLLFPWVDEIMRCEAILDAVQDLLGPDLLVWGTNFFIKDPGDGGYISWHQDSTYWGLSAPDVLTAWVALSPSMRASGAMRVVPGSHLHDQLPHRDTFAAGNLLTRGQEVQVQVDAAAAIDVELQPGEFSLHHVCIVHGSDPNCGADRRIGLAIRYIPTRLRQLAGERDYATLVRGSDRHHHFLPEPRPVVELGEAERGAHRRIVEDTLRILYRGARGAA